MYKIARCQDKILTKEINHDFSRNTLTALEALGHKGQVPPCDAIEASTKKHFRFQLCYILEIPGDMWEVICMNSHVVSKIVQVCLFFSIYVYPYFQCSIKLPPTAGKPS